MRNIAKDSGRCPKEAAAAKKGKIIEAAAPDVNITARPPRLADLSDVRSTFSVRSGHFAARALRRGIRSLAIADLPSV